MTPLRRTLLSLACVLLPVAAHAADAPGPKCKYVQVATLPVRYVGESMQPAVDGTIDGTPDQAIHAEAVVESLQAQLWSGAFDDALFLDGVRSACEARGRSVPALPPGAGAALFEQALALNVRWQQVPFHGSLELEMPGL